jgi:hypothetical protein
VYCVISVYDKVPLALRKTSMMCNIMTFGQHMWMSTNNYVRVVFFIFYDGEHFIGRNYIEIS